MSGKPRFEVVRSDAGWFARFKAGNGQKVWQTEVYGRRRAAVRAIDLIDSALVRGGPAWPDRIRDVDERGAKPAPAPPIRTGTVFPNDPSAYTTWNGGGAA